MEFVRLKYANNKLITSELKEHQAVICDYVEKRGYEYMGFIPVLFGPSGKVLEMDLIFKAPKGAKEVKEAKQNTVKK